MALFGFELVAIGKADSGFCFQNALDPDGYVPESQSQGCATRLGTARPRFWDPLSSTGRGSYQ